MLKKKKLHLILRGLTVFLLGIFLVVVGFVLGFQLNSKKSPESAMATLPNGWNASFEDTTYCHDVRVWPLGEYGRSIEDFILDKVYAGTKEEIPYKKVPYSIDEFPRTVSIQPMEPGISALIYFKSESGIVYGLVVYDSKNEYPGEEACKNLNSIIPNIIRILI